MSHDLVAGDARNESCASELCGFGMRSLWKYPRKVDFGPSVLCYRMDIDAVGEL